MTQELPGQHQSLVGTTGAEGVLAGIVSDPVATEDMRSAIAQKEAFFKTLLEQPGASIVPTGDNVRAVPLPEHGLILEVDSRTPQKDIDPTQ